MDDRNQIDQKAREFFEGLWNRGDPWNLESSEFERSKYDHQFMLIGGRRYERALELGCGAGLFTRQLARVAGRVTGVDISATAIARAREARTDPESIQYRVANVMEFPIADEGPWDLVVMSETICYLGWLYSFFDVAWMATQVFAATASGGRFLMANTCGGVDDYLLKPWLIRTYRDLFINVGFELESEELFRGLKNGNDIEVLISLFTKR